MAFNMLDDDFIPEEDGYTPSFIGGSRTGSMKKFTKKEDRPTTATTTLQKPVALKPTSNKDNLDDLDDLLDELIENKQKSSQRRPNTSILRSDNKTLSAFDDLKFSDDSGFGPKESITYNMERTIPKPLEIPKQNSFNAKDTFKLSDDFPQSSFDKKSVFTINEQQDISPLRNRRESVLRKQSPKNIVIEDDIPSLTIGSSRMMRPPIGRKQNPPSQNDQKPEALGLSLPDETVKLTQTAQPGKFGRRGSVSSQQRDDLNIKDDFKTPNYLAEDQPRLSRQSSLQFGQKAQQKIIVEKPVQRIVQRIIQKVVQGPRVDISDIKADFQKQLNILKQSYQKQTKIITQNYQRQLKEERDSKNKIMDDLKQIIEKQRLNHQKIIQQESERHKKMNQWEKEKLETTYKSQLQRLKSIIASQEKSIPDASLSYLQKRRIEDLEHKLKYQLDAVQAEKKKLAKIQSDLEQRQNQFNKFKASEEQKLKDQYNKSSDKTMKNMKKVSQQKNQIASEKQKLAVQMANMEMDLVNRKQNLLAQEQTMKINLQNFERTKYEAQMLNQQLYNSYKLKLQEAQESKKNALLLENQLLNKLKIVQLKGKQVYKGQAESNIFSNYQPSKTSNFVPSRPHSVNQNRRQPQDSSQRLKKVEGYMKTQALSSMNRTSMMQGNSSFTLDKFIKNVDGYRKQRHGGIF